MGMEKSMSDELYYRGSCSYEMAIKNRLDQLERSGARNATAMLDGVRNMEYGIRSDLRKSTYSIVASQELLAETFQQGFDSVNNTLSFGFERINDSITAMTEVICDKLDKIHDILNNPRLTAVRELYRRAATNFEKGYFEEALEDCLQATEKEKTDYFSWYLLGNIYLYGAGKFSNTIDLPKAEDAFFNAAKYIDADIGSSDEAKEFASQIYYGLGHTKLIMSNDLLVDNKLDESQRKLEEAKKIFEESIRFYNNNVKAIYDYAKVLHFMGDDEFLECVDEIIDIEEKFALFFVNDKNFESKWDQIEKVINTKKHKRIGELKKKISVELIDEYLNKIESTQFSDKLHTLRKNSENELDSYESKGFLTLCNDESNIIKKCQRLSEEIYDEYVCWKQKQHQKSLEYNEHMNILEIWNYIFKTIILMLKSDCNLLSISSGSVSDIRKCLQKKGKKYYSYLKFRRHGNFLESMSFHLTFPTKEYICDGFSFDCKEIKDGDLKIEMPRDYYFYAWWPNSDVRSFYSSETPLPEIGKDFGGSATDICNMPYRRSNLDKIISVAESCGYQELLDSIKAYEIELDNFLDRIINSKSFCFITTATCQSRHLPDNCHELETLRKFRDTFMKKNQEMKAEVEEYYQIAPVICENISRQKNSKEIYDSIWRDYLKSAVSAVDNGENQKAHDIYKKMVLDLKEKWF